MNILYSNLFFVGYVFFFTALMVGLFRWSVYRAKKKITEEKILRSPGEGLLNRMQVMDDNLPILYAAGIGGPLLVLGLFCSLLGYVPVSLRILYAISAVASFTFAVAFILKLTVHRFNEYRDCRLGYMAERYVAEQLDSLREDGYRIFHDLPCVGTKPFNIDHVIVGSAGVFAVETKARRKDLPSQFGDRKQHRLSYDGQSIIFPDGYRDYKPPAQAQAQAEWLEKLLRQELGFPFEVVPVLTYPFWIMDELPGPVLVRNPTRIHAEIISFRNRLTLGHIKAVTELLRVRCRDVEFFR